MNRSGHSTDLLRHAFELYRLGYVCVPLGPAGRHLDLGRMGYDPVHLKNRTKRLKELAFSSVVFHLCQQPPDELTVERWFANAPANLGIVGGYRDLLMLDFDGEANFQHWQRRFGDLVRATPVVKAFRGYHVYLRCRQPMPSSSLHYGLRRAGHVKALGGYITAPPSTKSDGATYRWLEGQSPYELQPQFIESLESVALLAKSPLKHVYDRLLKRGSFIDDCALPPVAPAMQRKAA